MSDPIVDKAREKAGEHWPTAEDAFEAGLKIRREIWGSTTLDTQIDSVSEFMWPLHDVVNRWCFGETWTRDELSPKTRSMLTLGMLVAMSRPNEIKVHVKGAMANGCTVEEIREVMLHSLVYCGIPKGLEGFRSAAEALRELGHDV